MELALRDYEVFRGDLALLPGEMSAVYAAGAGPKNCFALPN